jgi:hypothetical protein
MTYRVGIVGPKFIVIAIRVSSHRFRFNALKVPTDQRQHDFVWCGTYYNNTVRVLQHPCYKREIFLENASGVTSQNSLLYTLLTVDCSLDCSHLLRNFLQGCSVTLL